MVCRSIFNEILYLIFRIIYSSTWRCTVVISLSKIKQNWKNCGNYILLLDWNKCFERIHKNPLLNALGNLSRTLDAKISTKKKLNKLALQ